MCGVDLMTALILGSYGEQFKTGQKLAQSMGMQGDIPTVGSDKKYNLLGASNRPWATAATPLISMMVTALSAGIQARLLSRACWPRRLKRMSLGANT